MGQTSGCSVVNSFVIQQIFTSNFFQNSFLLKVICANECLILSCHYVLSVSLLNVFQTSTICRTGLPRTYLNWYVLNVKQPCRTCLSAIVCTRCFPSPRLCYRSSDSWFILRSLKDTFNKVQTNRKMFMNGK